MTLTTAKLLIDADSCESKEERYSFMGEAYGYPKCCVDFFINNVKPWWYDNLPWFSTRSLKMDGYIPCEKCANLPRQTLVDDINSRRKVEKIK
ncbi:hypothetical protein NVP1193O_195 [Vibrio phage 1.193.O._10N.286.52.C6]|nr:hypothetical protein NVP1193O_195 [Vibrio phage 1.193.O._10N.286.52.C6]